MFNNILAIIAVALLIWMLYRGVKGNPEAFSLANLNKSFMTLGILALILIGVIAFAVIMLKKA
jgi:hypothetical protein